jgi:uncharacterized repeat protein (TIGR04138 family)
MTLHYPRLEELVQRDPRYAYEAYEFVFAALAHTQVMLGRTTDEESEGSHHVSGRQLLEGVRDLALREFGLMARTVFRMWGIEKTGDFGNIVFNLIEAKLMSKTDEDTQLDFEDVYDLDQVLVHDYRIEVASEVD